MKRLVILFFLYVFCMQSYAKEWNGIRISDNQPSIDGWSICWIGWSGLNYQLIKLTGISSKKVYWYNNLLGFGLEFVKDGLQCGIGIDKKGFDIADPIFYCIGNSLMCLIDLLFDLNNKIQFIQKNGQFGVVIKFD